MSVFQAFLVVFILTMDKAFVKGELFVHSLQGKEVRDFCVDNSD